MATTTFSATARAESGLSIRCEARGKSFLLDEPPALGGKDTGMNPVEALLSALGACKCIVARSFAKSQGINLSDISIDLSGELDPDGFTGADPDAKIGFSSISETFHISADNTSEEVEAFLDFVESHCPVMDTIVNTPTFSRSLQLDRG